MTISEKIVMANKIMNGSGQGLRRFKLMNGKRVWIDEPNNEWQKRYEHDQINYQTNLFTNQ